MTEIQFTNIEFFVYTFENKEIITYPSLPRDENHQFGFKICGDELYGCAYIDKIKEKSSVKKSLNKSTYDKLNKLKGYFITHIDGDPIFSILGQLYQEHLSQNQGVIANNNNNVLFSIMCS